jgi:hypothetical protein
LFFNDINTLLSPFHGLMFIFKRLPQAKALVITHEIPRPLLACPAVAKF